MSLTEEQDFLKKLGQFDGLLTPEEEGFRFFNFCRSCKENVFYEHNELSRCVVEIGHTPDCNYPTKHAFDWAPYDPGCLLCNRCGKEVTLAGSHITAVGFLEVNSHRKDTPCQHLAGKGWGRSEDRFKFIWSSNAKLWVSVAP